MRKILFRGKRIDNREWVISGSIIRFNPENGEDLIYIPAYNEACISVHDENDNIEAIEKGMFYKVDPETIGQWTGLVDVNGVKIWEGDMAIYLRDADEVGEIRWDDNDACFYLLIENVAYTFSNIAGDCLEVIGNIHDKAVE